MQNRLAERKCILCHQHYNHSLKPSPSNSTKPFQKTEGQRSLKVFSMIWPARRKSIRQFPQSWLRSSTPISRAKKAPAKCFMPHLMWNLMIIPLQLSSLILWLYVTRTNWMGNAAMVHPTSSLKLFPLEILLTIISASYTITKLMVYVSTGS